jgi:hypothetical protein
MMNSKIINDYFKLNEFEEAYKKLEDKPKDEGIKIKEKLENKGIK